MNRYIKFRIVEKNGRFALQGKWHNRYEVKPIYKYFGIFKKQIGATLEEKEEEWEFIEKGSMGQFTISYDPFSGTALYGKSYETQINAEKALLKYIADNLIEPTKEDIQAASWKPVGKLS